MSTSSRSKLRSPDSNRTRRIYLVRHGETDYNRQRRFQGHINVPLNNAGRTQARAVSHCLAHRPIVHCVSSDLVRCVDTAREIAFHHRLDIETTPDLREAHLGVLQGRSWDDVSAEFEEQAAYLRQRDIRARPEGGESPLDVRRRVRRVARRLWQLPEDRPPGDVVVVAHGGSLRALLAVLLELPPAAGWVFRFDNCSVTTISHDRHGRALLESYNDCSHLVG